MNVLLLNGSPKGERSTTLKLTRHFLQGVAETASITLHSHNLMEKNLAYCTGCMACWRSGTGTCVQQDDLPQLIVEVLWADVVLLSFPLYFYGMPAVVKNSTDRMLQLLKPYDGTIVPEGEPLHEFLPTLQGKKLVVVSSCGYRETKAVYAPLLAQLDCICGKDRYTAIFCPQSQVFTVKELQLRLAAYYDTLRQAGAEFGRTLSLSPATKEALAQPPFSQRQFSILMKHFW